MTKRSMSGFTLLEVVIVIALVGFLAATLTPAISARLEAAKLEAAVGQAQRVLKVVEIARKKILSSSTAANGQVSHTYTTMATWQPISVLVPMLSNNYQLPQVNTFGLPLLVRFDATRSYVAVDLPFLETNYAWHPTQVVGGNTRIIISTKPYKSSSSNWVSHQKRVMHNEIAR